MKKLILPTITIIYNIKFKHNVIVEKRGLINDNSFKIRS